MRVMFSVHAGTSVAMVLRTRGIARRLHARGAEVAYAVSRRAAPYLDGYLDRASIHANPRDFTFTEAQESPDRFLDRFTEYAAEEAGIYHRFAPDVLVGDMPILAQAYRPTVPFVKIFNRFFLELGDDAADSPFTPAERALIRGQMEHGINHVRARLGLPADFAYSALLEPPVVANGEAYFLDDLRADYLRVGLSMKLQPPAGHRPDPGCCFVALGTGLDHAQAPVFSEILRRIAGRFRRVYAAYGTLLSPGDVHAPPNAVLRPTFDELPPDVGLLVCHGGYALLHLGARLGIPVVAVPLKVEVFSNAHRMERLGVGLNVSRRAEGAFRGGYGDFRVDWDAFDAALARPAEVRTAPPLHGEEGSAGLEERVEALVLAAAGAGEG